MKKFLGSGLVLAVLTGGISAQPLPADKVPAGVRESLQSKFPGVTKVEWKLKTDKNYEAEFSLKGAEVAAKFDPKGNWLETETTIGQADLPKEVQAALARAYKDYKIIETQKVERAGAKPILFEVHVENAKEVLKLQLEANGSVFSKSTTPRNGPS